MAYFNGFTCGCAEWKLTISLVGEADYTNSESTQDGNGVAFANRKACVKDLVLTATIIFDIDNPPYLSPPNLITGAVLSTTRFYVSKTGSKYFSFPLLVVTEDAVTMQIKDILRTNLTAKPNGTWSYPV